MITSLDIEEKEAKIASIDNNSLCLISDLYSEKTSFAIPLKKEQESRII